MPEVVTKARFLPTNYHELNFSESESATGVTVQALAVDWRLGNTFTCVRMCLALLLGHAGKPDSATDMVLSDCPCKRFDASVSVSQAPAVPGRNLQQFLHASE